MAKPRSTPVYNPFADLAEIRTGASDHSGSQTSERSGSPAPKSLAKSQDPRFVKLTAYVPKELHRETRSRLIQEGKELSTLIEELLSYWIQKKSSQLT